MNSRKYLFGVRYRIPSHRQVIRNVCEAAVTTLKMTGLSLDFNQLYLVLKEALNNAFLYGNLEIPSDLRESEEEGFFWQIVEHREQDEAFRSKEIALQLDILEDRIRCRVKG